MAGTAGTVVSPTAPLANIGVVAGVGTATLGVRSITLTRASFILFLAGRAEHRPRVRLDGGRYS
jgi:hypothetical protein